MLRTVHVPHTLTACSPVTLLANYDVLANI